jgi:hypothetical protein
MYIGKKRTRLPHDVLVRTLSFLVHADVVVCGQVCRKFRAASSDYRLWMYSVFREQEEIRQYSLPEMLPWKYMAFHSEAVGPKGKLRVDVGGLFSKNTHLTFAQFQRQWKKIIGTVCVPAKKSSSFRSFVCPVEKCGAAFTNRNARFRHLCREHRIGHRCDVCGHVFAYPYLLKRHSTIHV